MKLTNEEIARVFMQYWQAKFVYSGSLGTVRTLMGITRGWNITDDTDEDISYRTDKCQLLLTPLSKISDEHAIEIATMRMWLSTTYGVKRTKQELLDKVNRYLNGTSEPHFNIFQYLISKGYAVPLWLGIGHWANGKTAIQLGIAIEKYSNYEGL